MPRPGIVSTASWGTQKPDDILASAYLCAVSFSFSVMAPSYESKERSGAFGVLKFFPPSPAPAPAQHGNLP